MIWLIVWAVLLAVYSAAARSFCRSFAYRQLKKGEGGLAGSGLERWYRQPGRTLASLRLGSLAGIVLTLWSALRLANRFYYTGIVEADAVVVGLLSVGVTAFCALAPAMLVKKAGPDRVLTWVWVPVWVLSIVVLPVTDLFLGFTRVVARLWHNEPTDEEVAVALGYVARQPYEDGLDEEGEPMQAADRQILDNALHFSDIRLRDCLVPRIEIVAVEKGAPLEELLATFTRSGKTKVIVYEGDIDHIVGYVHASEMFKPIEDGDWSGGIQTIPIVPEAMNARRCMQILMQQKKSLALIADEFGGTAGIVSLEDLVEEIFGEIEDEHDKQTLTARRTAEGEYVVSARHEIGRINEMFDLELPESDDYQTLGGLILWELQDFPKVGQTLSVAGYQLRILKTQSAKIDLVKIGVKSEAARPSDQN